MAFPPGMSDEVLGEMPDLDVPYSEVWADFPGGLSPFRMRPGWKLVSGKTVEGDTLLSASERQTEETYVLTREEEMVRRAEWAENPYLRDLLPDTMILWDKLDPHRDGEPRSRTLNPPPSKKPTKIYPTIFFVGNERSGKTSMLNLFLGREHAQVQRTSYMDYEFARRPRPDGERDVCRFWELGGDARDYEEFIDDPFKAHEYPHHGFVNLTIFIVLDLSCPISIWPTFNAILTQLKSGFKQALKGMDTATSVRIAQELEEKLSLRLENVSEGDQKFLDPFHIPVVIFGSKYDLFKDLEPETVKTVSRILRLCSHIIGATLCFYSREDPVLKRRFRELVSHYGFHTKFPAGKETSGALFIPAGTDSFEEIWPSRTPAQCTLDFCQSHAESRLGLDGEHPDPNAVHPALDPRYPDPVFDKMYAAARARAKAYVDSK